MKAGSWQNYIIIIVACISAASGQVLFKKGMSGLNAAGAMDYIRAVLSLKIIGGLFFYGLSTLMWLYALSVLDLNKVYPFTLLTFILVMVASVYIFRETLTTKSYIAFALIIAGIIVNSV